MSNIEKKSKADEEAVNTAHDLIRSNAVVTAVLTENADTNFDKVYTGRHA